MRLFKGARLLCAALLVTGVAGADTARISLDQPASVVVRESADGCHNNPGPFISMDGELSLGGVNARLILTNNRRWTHVTSEDVTVDVSVIAAGDEIRFAKQPPQGGVGGNPYIYLWFNDCNGATLTAEPTFLGRCVQGLSPTALNFEMPTDVEISVGADACTNHPGPFVNLNGEIALGGLCGTLIFTNQQKFVHVHEEDVLVEVVLLQEGATLTFSKKPPEGGVGGNPYIWVQFLDGASQEIGDPLFVGRCNELRKSGRATSSGSGNTLADESAAGASADGWSVPYREVSY